MESPASAKSTAALRGDYGTAAADFTIAQDWDGYSAAMHDRWRRLYARQAALAQHHAAPEVWSGLARLDCADGIPRFDRTSTSLAAATGWRIVAVPGLIPEAAFFDHLANRRFPVTVWIREESELDYLVEPDVFHDFFGHVPLLFDPAFAAFLQAYGEAGERAMAMDALELLARIYWYTVEFGLIAGSGGVKAFGAGLVSSAGELVHSVTDPSALRLRFDPERIMRTAYVIDRFQPVYFVIDSLEQLMKSLIDLDFGPLYERWRAAAPIPPGAETPGDTRILLTDQTS